MRDPPSFDQPRGSLSQHDQDIGLGKAQQRGHDGSVQKLARARAKFDGSRLRNGSVSSGGDYHSLASCCAAHEAFRFRAMRLPDAEFDDCCAAARF